MDDEDRLAERFEFRDIRPDETDQGIVIEQLCFPPEEACSPEHMRERIEAAPELFLAAIDRETGEIAGFLNGLATDETEFRDEFFTDVSLYEPDGKVIMLLGLDVLPAYRGQGLARQLVREYVRRSENEGRERLILTCLESKVPMYEKFGFVDDGISQSVWGGEEWHAMTYWL